MEKEANKFLNFFDVKTYRKRSKTLIQRNALYKKIETEAKRASRL